MSINADNFFYADNPPNLAKQTTPKACITRLKQLKLYGKSLEEILEEKHIMMMETPIEGVPTILRPDYIEQYGQDDLPFYHKLYRLIKCDHNKAFLTKREIDISTGEHVFTPQTKQLVAEALKSAGFFVKKFSAMHEALNHDVVESQQPYYPNEASQSLAFWKDCVRELLDMAHGCDVTIDPTFYRLAERPYPDLDLYKNKIVSSVERRRVHTLNDHIEALMQLGHQAQSLQNIVVQEYQAMDKNVQTKHSLTHSTLYESEKAKDDLNNVYMLKTFLEDACHHELSEREKFAVFFDPNNVMYQNATIMIIGALKGMNVLIKDTQNKSSQLSIFLNDTQIDKPTSQKFTREMQTKSQRQKMYEEAYDHIVDMAELLNVALPPQLRAKKFLATLAI